MANRRMIASDIFEDEFFCELSLTERLLWIGLIAQCADDQGRLQDRPNMINSRIFPDDGLSVSEIEKGLDKFARTGKIVRYEFENKSLIQIVKWWSYQTPAWATPSKFPAPNKWTDRVKVHVSGNKIHMENWDKPGGYIDGYVAGYVPPLPIPIEDVNVNGYGYGYGEVKGATPEIIATGDLLPYYDTFQKETHINNIRTDIAVEAFRKIKDAGATVEDMTEAIHALIDKGYAITSPKSVVNSSISSMNYRLRNTKNNLSEPDTFIDILPDGTQIQKLRVMANV